MAFIPIALKATVVKMRFSRHICPRDISYLLDMPLSTVYHILKVWSETGLYEKEKSLPRGRPRLLSYDDTRLLCGTLELRNDYYLDELKQIIENRCGIQCSETTIWRTLKRVGFTLKKISKEALERNEAQRAEYRLRMAENYRPGQLVFVDESACDRRTYIWNEAWALQGLRAVRKAFFVRGKRYSILPGISLDGVIECMIIEGSFNAEIFAIFIEKLLKHMQPFPANNSVIVMDNCPIHKSSEIRELVEAKGVRLEFLPAYSPDLNPIEQAFSLLKSRLHREGQVPCSNAGDDYEIYEKLYRQVYSLTADNMRSFFYHSGYL
ncbi:hypothetical protein ACEPAH_3106 [Sanghuangporus vaninii]